MVKFSSPNAPSTWLIFLCPRTHASAQTCHHSASSVLAVRISCRVVAVFTFRKRKRRMEKSVNTHNRLKYFLTHKSFLITDYVQVRTYDLRCKMCNNNTFFHCLCSALMEKHNFYCSVIPWNCTWYCIVQLLYFVIAQSSLEDMAKTSESLTLIRTREKVHCKCTM